MSFFNRLFGRGGKQSKDVKSFASVDYRGFIIEARPFKEGGQWQLAGAIIRLGDGERQEHDFIRADRFAERDEAVQLALQKGRQLVDEQGGRLFSGS